MKIIADLIRAGVDPELVARVAEALDGKGDAAAEKRRAWDRERKRRLKAEKVENSTVPDAESTAEIPVEKGAPKELIKTPSQNLSSLRSDSSTAVAVDLFGAEGDQGKAPAQPAKPAKRPKLNDLATIEAISDLWDEFAVSLNLPTLRGLSKSREAKVRRRLKDLKTLGFEDPIAGFREVLAKIRGSPYLRGEVNGFRASLDFVLQESSMLKILEGNYDAKTGRPYGGSGGPGRTYHS